jgi:hypothetical protein
MVTNILSVFAGASLCWIGTALRTSTVFGRTFTSEGARTFFSNGFQEVIKQSAIRFTRNFPDITYRTDMTQKDRDAALSYPMQFQNDMINAFDRCAEKVQRQLSDMIEEIESSGDRSGPIGDLVRAYAYDLSDFTLSDRQILDKIDGPYGMIDQLVKAMNGHCVKSAFYFREKPAFDTESASDFIDAMAVRFERAMWAAWIPNNLKQMRRAQLPASRTSQLANQPWKPEYFSSQNLRNLQPGYYYMVDNPDYVMRVYETLEKPGRTLEDQLEILKVIKSKDYKPAALPDQLRQLNNFGAVTSKSEIKKLIACIRRAIWENN